MVRSIFKWCSLLARSVPLDSCTKAIFTWRAAQEMHLFRGTHDIFLPCCAFFYECQSKALLKRFLGAALWELLSMHGIVLSQRGRVLVYSWKPISIYCIHSSIWKEGICIFCSWLIIKALLSPLCMLRAWCLSRDHPPRFEGTSSKPCISAVLLSHWITPGHVSYS